MIVWRLTVLVSPPYLEQLMPARLNRHTKFIICRETEHCHRTDTEGK